MEVVIVAALGIVSSMILAMASYLVPSQERKAVREAAFDDLRFERAMRLIEAIRENRYVPTRENERAMADAYMAMIAALREGEHIFEEFLGRGIEHIRNTSVRPGVRPVDQFGRVVFRYLRREVRAADLSAMYPGAASP